MAKYEVCVKCNFEYVVEVEADNIEEAKADAKYGVSKCYEYIDWDSDYITFMGGCGNITTEGAILSDILTL